MVARTDTNKATPASSGANGNPSGVNRKPAGLKGLADIAVGVAVVLAGAFAALSLPEGPLRLTLTLAALFVAPGYLLMQAAFVPARPFARGSSPQAAFLPPEHSSRVLHLFVSLGLSPVVVALLALSTAFFGAFRPVPIVVAITLGCLAMAAVAVVRRLRNPAPTPGAPPAASTSSATEPSSA